MGINPKKLLEYGLITQDKIGRSLLTPAGTLLITKDIEVETYLYFKNWLYSKMEEEISNLEIILILTLSNNGKGINIPYPQIKDIREKEIKDWKKYFHNKILKLIIDKKEEGKRLYQNILKPPTPNGKNECLKEEDYLAIKKTLLLYDWINNKEIKSIQQEYGLQANSIQRLGKSFSWLADSLAAVAESMGWAKDNPKGLEKTKTRNLQLAPRNLQPLLQIAHHRPDRIIFQSKEIKVTARGFSLLYLLAQHKGEVVSYDNILDELWKDDEDAIYTRIIQHIYKFRRDILDAIGNNKTNKEKVKNIFKVVSGRGVMLNINDNKLKIN